MAARNLVLNDGVLSAEVVSYEPVELAQLEAVVTTKQQAVDEAQAQVDAANQVLSDAQAALSDSKSEHEVGSGLVAAATPPAESETTEPSPDGADGAAENNPQELQV
jgi:uncharacterized coiled-coil protein SlyX